MKSTLLTLLAQRNEGQTEYFMAYALIVAVVLLGTLAVCIPRPRQKHFVEPEENVEEDVSRKKKRR